MNFLRGRPGLFWRTFLLILLLLTASTVAWLQSFRVFEREPRAQQLAERLVAVVDLTRSALLYADADERPALLADLADSQGIRIVPLETADRVQPLADDPVLRLAAARVLAALGDRTRLAAAVNGVEGIWVSFDIDADQYWVMMERDPLARDIGTAWIGWALIAAVASLLAAVVITREVNRPLARLSRAARELGAGRAPAALPERGPVEIATVNRSFNRMVGDLAQLERDRMVLLAGISHDLRTPLTRLRLELELAELPAQARRDMIGDLEQMDRIVAQFLDYARSEPAQPKTKLDVSALLEQAIEASRLDRDPTARIDRRIEPGLMIDALPTELARALANLLANADRYGRDAASGRLNLDLSLRSEAAAVLLEVADQGPGLPPDRYDEVLRPFVRGEHARSGVDGAGLGLAIVERIARLHGGSVQLLANTPRGLRVRMRLPRPA